MANIYAPNIDEPIFFLNLFLSLYNLSGNYILAGDFNCTLDPVSDRSSGIDQSNNTPFHEGYEFDRHLEGDSSDKYSTHKSYSRIDFFRISASLKYKIKDCSNDAILLSDHAPTSIVYQDFQLVRDPPDGISS